TDKTLSRKPGAVHRQPSGKNIIRWLLKKRTNGSVRYCQYTSLSFVFFYGKSGISVTPYIIC
ncbi:TPA: hypothetical protein ACHK0D_004769, partial [Escherichia coli]